MTTAVWIAIILAVVIVSLAVGIPYWLTHRRMTDPYDHESSKKYIAATGRTVEDVAAGRPGRPWRRTTPRGQSSRAARRGTAPADRSGGAGTP